MCISNQCWRNRKSTWMDNCLVSWSSSSQWGARWHHSWQLSAKLYYLSTSTHLIFLLSLAFPFLLFSRGDTIISWFSEMDQHLVLTLLLQLKILLHKKVGFFFSEEVISWSLCDKINCSASWRAMEDPRVTWRWLPCGSLVWPGRFGCGVSMVVASIVGLICSGPSPTHQPFLFVACSRLVVNTSPYRSFL